MHPLDARDDRKEYAQEQQGLGYCNITKCCTEVCPEHIKITDNAIIPMKERVVDRKYDPLVWLGRKIFRRHPDDDQLVEAGARHSLVAPPAAHASPGSPGSPGSPDSPASEVQRANWHRSLAAAQLAAVDDEGNLPISEVAFDRSGAPSPFGEDVQFPLPPGSSTTPTPTRTDCLLGPASSYGAGPIALICARPSGARPFAPARKRARPWRASPGPVRGHTSVAVRRRRVSAGVFPDQAGEPRGQRGGSRRAATIGASAGSQGTESMSSTPSHRISACSSGCGSPLTSVAA